VAPRLTILHDADLDPQAPVIKRIAVRAVVPRESTLLLLRTRHGVHKFPGGGVEPGEELFAALARELREECGVADLRVDSLFMTAVERSRAQEAGHVFEMTSHYYWCSTVNGASTLPQRLDAYEEDLGLAPVWVAPQDAIALNQSLAATSPAVTPWLERDLRVLRAVADCWAGSRHIR
jgi:ADP-ribose pyrophosphatase YjhB (NUDIX family)